MGSRWLDSRVEALLNMNGIGVVKRPSAVVDAKRTGGGSHEESPAAAERPRLLACADQVSNTCRKASRRGAFCVTGESVPASSLIAAGCCSM